MTTQGSFLLPELSRARMTTLPLWRITSRSLCLPPGSMSLSWRTLNSEHSKMTSELSSWAVSTGAGLGALDLRALEGLPFLSLTLADLGTFCFLDIERVLLGAKSVER